MMKTSEAKEFIADSKLHAKTERNAIVRENKIKAYLEFLEEIYIELADGPKKLGLVKRLEIARLPTWLPKILVNEKILFKEYEGASAAYGWMNKSNEPDLKMASQILDAFEKASKISQKNSLKNKLDHLFSQQNKRFICRLIYHLSIIGRNRFSFAFYYLSFSFF